MNRIRALVPSLLMASTFLSLMGTSAARADETLMGRIGNQDVYCSIDNDRTAKEVLNLKKAALTDALIMEVAERHGISAEPEFTRQWKAYLADVSTLAKSNFDLEELPPRLKEVMKKKSEEFRMATLHLKVTKFIVGDLMDHDKKFHDVFTESPSGGALDPALYDYVSRNVGVSVFRGQAIAKWWMHFIANEHATFRDADCEREYGILKRQGLM